MCVCACASACACVCVSGVVVTKIINYSSFGFRPSQLHFQKYHLNLINTDSNKQLYALIVVAVW